jgi:hypothetical protein
LKLALHPRGTTGGLVDVSCGAPVVTKHVLRRKPATSYLYSYRKRATIWVATRGRTAAAAMVLKQDPPLQLNSFNSKVYSSVDRHHKTAVHTSRLCGHSAKSHAMKQSTLRRIDERPGPNGEVFLWPCSASTTERMKGKLLTAGLLPTRPRIALCGLLFSKRDRHVTNAKPTPPT